MEKKIDESRKNIIIIGILVIIGIIGIGVLAIVKTTSVVQLNTVEAQQDQHVASSELNKADTKSVKVDSSVLVKDLHKSHKLNLAKVALQNKDLLAKSLNKNSKHLLLKGLKNNKGLLLNELAQDKLLLEVLSFQSSLKSHLLVDRLPSKEVL